jgi:DNA-binding beta-propeller fold protein YncE
MDSTGNLYVGDRGNFTIRKLSRAGHGWLVTTLAGVPALAGSADGTGPYAIFAWPAGVAVDEAGNVYVADQANSTIRKGWPAGQ